MFNPFAIKVSKDTRKMGLLAKLKLGGLAADVVEWARDVVRTIDFDAVLQITGYVLAIERNMRGQPGQAKLDALLKKITEIYPGGNIAVITGYVRVLVTLLNGLGVFRK